MAEWVTKILDISEKNLDYIGTSFSILLGLVTFSLEQQKYMNSIQEKIEEADKGKKEAEEKIQKLEREKLENYKDMYRPTFMLNKIGTKLIVIMKNKDFYLENVCYYKSADGEAIELNNLMHMDEVDLCGSVNNYFLTGETIIGEKIIFGVILNRIKIYKALKENCLPVIPNRFLGEFKRDTINLNWSSFNGVVLEFDDIDINFMYKTVKIREKMALSTTEHMKEIMAQRDVKNLFIATLNSLVVNKREFTEENRKDVIEELLDILAENRDRIGIKPTAIPADIWEYVSKKINIDNRYYNSLDEISAIYVIKQYVDFDEYELDNIISVFLMLISYGKFDEKTDEHTILYSVRIINKIER